MKLNAKQIAELLAAALAPVLATIIGEAKAAPADDADDAEEEPAPAKRGRGRPKKEAAAATKAATKKSTKKAPVEEEDEDEDPLADDADDDGDEDDDIGLDDGDEEVTQEDVVNAFKALKASKGIDKCREVLAKLDESNVLTIPAKKYGEALKEINRAASKK